MRMTLSGLKSITTETDTCRVHETLRAIPGPAFTITKHSCRPFWLGWTDAVMLGVTASFRWRSVSPNAFWAISADFSDAAADLSDASADLPALLEAQMPKMRERMSAKADIANVRDVPYPLAHYHGRLFLESRLCR